jgi:C-terminal processing protease CtpA/Prc
MLRAKASILCRFACFIVVAAFGTESIARQSFNDRAREADLQMLKDAKEALHKYYYDPKFNGVEMDTLYGQYQQRIQESQSNHEAFTLIAAFVDSLNDSHTKFIPPDRVGRLDYGFTLNMIGDTCYVTHVRPGSDAESKLHPGDRVMARDGGIVTRADFAQMLYYFNVLSPVTVSNFDLADTQGNARHAAVDSKIWMQAKVVDLTGNDGGAAIFNLQRQEEQQYDMARDRYVEAGDALIWKMPEFIDDHSQIDSMIGIARKHKAVILDLRGNPGGLAETLQDMAGFFFDHEVKLFDRVTRKGTKPVIAKSKGSYGFSGKLIVLIDSGSASAAELFARVIQLENRGTVLGDRSSGQVMEARLYPYQQGVDSVIPYGFEITSADLLMKDGKSLEHVGVSPDQTLLPTAQDLANGADPVLAHAAQMAGVDMSPAQAGKLFPYVWQPF